MSTVQVIFSRRAQLGSLLLRTFMWSAWSHCAIVDGDHVVEAVMFKGVTDERTVDEFKAAASKWEIVEIPCADPAAVIAAARARIGLGYDWLGIIAVLLRVEMQINLRDFCSKLIAEAFKNAGQPLFRVEPWRILPRDLYVRTY